MKYIAVVITSFFAGVIAAAIYLHEPIVIKDHVANISGETATILSSANSGVSHDITVYQAGEGTNTISIGYDSIPPARNWISRRKMLSTVVSPLSKEIDLLAGYRFESLVFSGGVRYSYDTFHVYPLISASYLF